MLTNHKFRIFLHKKRLLFPFMPQFATTLAEKAFDINITSVDYKNMKMSIKEYLYRKKPIIMQEEQKKSSNFQNFIIFFKNLLTNQKFFDIIRKSSKESQILGHRQAVRQRTLTPSLPGFESLCPSQKIKRSLYVVFLFFR